MSAFQGLMLKIFLKELIMTNTLKLVLTDHWFEEIKSGRKTHEYRECKWFWIKRLLNDASYREDLYRFVIGDSDFTDIPNSINEFSEVSTRFIYKYNIVEFQKAYRKNAEKMLFHIKNISICNGKNTDLHCEGIVFDIELGERIK